MRKLLTLYIVLILVALTNGQNYVSLFSKDLPKDLLKYYSSASVNDILKMDGNLNPEILYWRINYFNEVISNKNSDAKKNGYNYLTKLISDNYKVRNAFFDKQLLIAEGLHNEYSGKIIEYLSGRCQNPELSNLYEYNNPQVDSNKINYIVVKYYSRNSDLVYDQAIDYSLRRNACEKEALNNLFSIESDIDNPDKELSMINLDVFADHWLTLSNNQNSIDNMPAILNKYYQRKNSINGVKQFSAIVGYSGYSINNAYSYSFPVPGFDSQINNGEKINLSVISFQAGYKLFLKKTISLFSYVDFGFMGRYGSVGPKTENNQIFNKNFDVIDADNYSMDYLKLYNFNLSKTSYMGIYFRSLTPVFIISNYMFFEGGISLGADFRKSSVTYTYDYEMDKITYNNGYHTTPLGSGNNIVNSYDLSKITFYITPLIEARFSLLSPFIINLTVGVDYGSISAGLEF